MMKRLGLSLVCLAGALAVAQAKDDYQLGPDSMEQAGVPKGEIHEYKNWESSVFKGTLRDWWIYVPKQYDGKEPACVMVFQDGGGYKNPKGQYRATTVLDNLIHKKELPVIIGIFINPGTFPGKDKKKGGSNRSFEYDSLTPQYAEFLEKEILPEVSKKFKLRQDAAGRGICGASSGGICSFTVAWERPDLFSKVLSHIGSFTNIRGGDRYPGIIRKSPNKPIRVFLQDGSNDLDNPAGHWYLSNLQMEAALKFKKYDYKTVWGDGGHTGKHGGAILPDSLRWLWRDTPPAPAAKSAEKK
ncbi:MAG TPA: alpha/beta hydrolase-fold protein [Gemmataceae bacterium]|nr:alpha/beta hydrolase-fold protein [Gemmataceae bacterium]